MEPDLRGEQAKLADAVARLEAIESRMKLPMAPDEVPSGSAQKVKAPSALEAIDRRIAEADPFDAQLWVRLRNEIVKQEAFAKDQEHLQRVEAFQLRAKLALSFIALVAGVGLVIGGFDFPAFVCLGAGLYSLAPNFIERITGRILDRGSNHND